MDIAIVTGASSSLGLAISRRLIQLGFRVYGLGGDYADCPLQNVNFRPVSCNLADPAAVEAAAKRILEKEKGVLVLVNNAKYFGSQHYLEMSPEEMQRVLNINLLCPLVLARTLADGLMTLQGYIIQLGPLHVESSRGGPSGAAAAGGLKWMSELLFQDMRDHGVRVCHLSPEPNRGRDPRTTARHGTKVTASIDPEAVAQALEQLLQSPYGNIITEMVMRPLRVSEPEHDPVVKLPYPKPKPVPYTIPREMIEAEEQLEEEDFKKKQKEKRSRRQDNQKKAAAKKATVKKVSRKEEEEPEKQTPEAAEDKPKKASRRRSSRRRPDKVDTVEKGSTEPKPENVKQEEGKPEPDQTESKRPEPESTPEKSSRRRSRRKPRPPKVEVGFHKDSSPAKPEEAEKKNIPEESEDLSAKKKTPKRKRPARKKAAPVAQATERKEPVEAKAKKAARKSTRKVAKKTAKKAATARKVPRKRAAKKAKSDAKSD